MQKRSRKLRIEKATIAWLWKRKWLLGGLAAAGFLIIATGRILPGGYGIGSRTSIVTAEEKDPQKITVKKTETKSTSPGKSLWDLLDLLGVPLALALLGAWFQQSQRKQDADDAREEVLQLYFDRISKLLIDKNLMAIASKGDNAPAESKELLEASRDIIRARTLSILRRFEEDINRKSSVVRFLAESEIISKLRLDLKGANLTGTDLTGTDLTGAYLIGTDLTGTNLTGTNLTGAWLWGSNLTNTILLSANLTDAKLLGANLTSAWLLGTDLTKTVLIGTNLENIRFNNETIWPEKEEVAKAKNVPIELQKQLGLAPQTPQKQTTDQHPPTPPQ